MDEEYCLFPEPWEVFEFSERTVKVGTFEHEITYNEVEFWRFLQLACSKYSSLHPEQAESLGQLISSSFPDSQQPD
ncbi:hypothetical protein [Roseateles amylovorans]|uniref:Uncharacterized protein n=1 Tax=Roseateles amylovorans TaxID=2978473 RepID=A0ABY6AXH0_9BURK|nr:hypothetical protein [Roseateles amylovorans]UXH77372.1 hypothetical protein N4261_20560 [Roseateles amylovorans]